MIGLFDSGLGGLSVLRELLHHAPGLDIHYHADQARIPWGHRPAAELREYCARITQHFVDEGCTHVVVACNTASAVALQALRESFPGQVFVGMEPAIKPAAAQTRSGVIGLMATEATLAGELLANTRARHAAHLNIVSDPCRGLVEAIESGDTQIMQRTLERIVPPLVQAGADVLVLGCTHYPFVTDAIQQMAGSGVTVVDPAPAVVSQLLRLISSHRMGRRSAAVAPQTGSLRLSTSGNPQRFSERASTLLERSLVAEHLDWAREPAVETRP